MNSIQPCRKPEFVITQVTKAQCDDRWLGVGGAYDNNESDKKTKWEESMAWHSRYSVNVSLGAALESTYLRQDWAGDEHWCLGAEQEIIKAARVGL